MFAATKCQSPLNKIDWISGEQSVNAMEAHCGPIDMSTPAVEIADFIQQFVKQQQSDQGSCVKLTGEKGYHSVYSGARHHFIIGLVIDLDDKTIRMEITKGHYFQALAPLHQYVLDALGFEKGRGPVFSYEDTDAVILHSKLAAAVIDSVLSMQKAMSASRLRST